MSRRETLKEVDKKIEQFTDAAIIRYGADIPEMWVDVVSDLVEWLKKEMEAET